MGHTVNMVYSLVLLLATSALAAPGTDRAFDRIVGGTEVKQNAKYPYQIWVQGLGACGGSIINKRYILSAAHCFGKVGEKIIMHPGYNAELGNDVALIKVKRDIEFSKKVQPVCLAKDKKKDYTGQMATVTGWEAPRATTLDRRHL